MAFPPTMKLSALIFTALATATSFSLKATSSDKVFDNIPVKKVDSHPHVFAVGGNAGEDLVLLFRSDGNTLVDQTGRGVNVDPNTGEIGNVAPFGNVTATPGFSISDGHLEFDNAQNWKACPGGGTKYSLTNKGGDWCESITLDVVYE